MIVVVLACPARALAQADSGSRPAERPEDAVIRAELEALDRAELERFLREIDESMRELFPDLDLAGMVRSPRDAATRLDAAEIVSGLARVFAREVRGSLALLGQLVVLGVMCAILSELAGLSSEDVARIARAACLMVLATMAASSFLSVAGVASGAIERMTTFIHSATPLLFALLAAVGGVASAAVMSPAVVAAAGATGAIVRDVVLPLVFLSIVLEMVSAIVGRVQLTRLGALLREGGVAALGGFMTVFVGVMTVRGVGAAVVDTASIRAAKFVSGTFIPVVGKMFSDAVAIVASCSALIHSGLSVAGLLAVLMICLVPAAKVFSVAAMYKIASAIVQPLGDEQLAKVLGSLGSALVMVLVALGVTAFAFVAAISVVSALANFTAAVR